MSIVATEVTVTGTTQRVCHYRCKDSQGKWHDYGPVISVDPAFDPEAHKVAVAAKVAARLAEDEFESVTA